MQLDCTTLVALLKSGGVSSVRLFELAQPLLQDETNIGPLYSKLIDAVEQEFNWSEECKRPISPPFFERAYEFFIAVLPLANSKYEAQLVKLFTFTEQFLTYQMGDHKQAHHPLVFVAERVNDRIVDILGCNSKPFFDLYIKRYSRLLEALFGPSMAPNFRILALQRIISHISHTIMAISPDAALATLTYLLTDMTLNIEAWSVDTIISLFNHAVQLACSMSPEFQCLFARSLIEVARMLVSNTLIYSFFDSKLVSALSRTLLRGLLLLLDKQDILDKIKGTSDATYFISCISNAIFTLDDEGLGEHYNRLASALGASPRQLSG